MKMNIAFATLVLSLSSYGQVNFNQLIKESAVQPQKKEQPAKTSTQNQQIRHAEMIEKKAKSEDWQKKISELNKNAENSARLFRERGGSGIGGGNSQTTLIDWCDQASEMLDETRLNAQEKLGLYNDKMSALKIYFEGLRDALEISQNQTATSSITYRAILRGLNLSAQLGIIDLVYGNGNYSAKKLDDAIYFLDDYYQFVLSTAYQYDQRFLATNCVDCTRPSRRSIDQLEKEFIHFVTSQVRFWVNKFIPEQSNREGAFSTISLNNALQGLAYLAEVSALDLETSYYSNVYKCQSNQLKRLSKRITNAIANTPDQSIQTAKLTIYREQALNVVMKIETSNCNF